jgi:PTS system cellobiose-specific IIC component
MSRSSDASRQSSDDSSLAAAFGAVGWIERRVAPFAERFGNAPAVRALREALPISFIGLLVGLALIVAFVEPGSFVDRLRASIPGAFAVMSIVLVIVLSARLAIRLRYLIAPTIGGSILAFAFALPREALRSAAPPAPGLAHPPRCDVHCIGAAASREFDNLSVLLGTSGLFTAIVACLLTVGVIGLVRRRIPGDKGVVVGALIVWIGSFVLYALHLSIGGALDTIISPLRDLGDSFAALVIITAVETVLFLIGVHGPALLAALVLPVYINLQFANTAAYAHHEPLPHLVVVSTFLYVFPGGCGATLPLIVLLLRSRVPRLRTFARATIVPSLISTNEPVMFGLPLVYNPVLGIPYVLAPLVLCCTTYAALALGWVRPPISYMFSTVPVFLNTFLATLDWRSLVLVAVNLTIAGAIYLPFVRIYERLEMQKSR